MLKIQNCLLSLLLVFCYNIAEAQQTSPKRWLDSVVLITREIEELKKTHGFGGLQDSSLTVNNDQVIPRFDSSAFKKNIKGVPQIEPGPKRALLSFQGGYINYNFNYRSAIDTPFQEKGLSQHLINGSLSLTLSQAVPITITYFERQSNSRFFRDYRDVRVEFNAAEFQRLKNQRLSSYIEKAGSKLRNPVTKPSLDYSNRQLQNLDDWFRRRDVSNKLIESRSAVLNGGTIDSISHQKDTSVHAARDFLAFYELLKTKQEKLKVYRDSLQKDYVFTEKQIAGLKKLLNSNVSAEEKLHALEPLLAAQGDDARKLKRLFGVLGSIQSFGVGKVLPNHSELTLKNVNVNGINFEYYRRFYFAVSAGAIDYRARDFFYTGGKRKPQFVYLTRMGYGSKQGSHVYLTGYKGKKQLLSSAHNPAYLDIYGLSFESQVVINKNHRVIGEVAQSASPDLISLNGVNEKPSFNLNDGKNKAWTVKLNSNFPKTRSRIEAYYKYRGINFQSFSSYYSNATQYSWQIKGDQYFWRRQLKVNFSIAHNNYENSELPVRYSGQTNFKSVSVVFKRKRWPSLQAGFMPSSQLSEINGQIFENFYQSLNLGVNHYYKVGLAQGFSLFSYNRFYNNSKDTGFIYYNAKNYYFSQLFQFPSYSATVNITKSDSRDYALTVFDAGVSAKVRKRNVVGFGVKINQLNDETLKVGIYGNGKLEIPKVGELNAWIEKSYLPGWGGKLIKNELYNIGFTRFFK